LLIIAREDIPPALLYGEADFRRTAFEMTSRMAISLKRAKFGDGHEKRYAPRLS
jgi:hypothetical protein